MANIMQKNIVLSSDVSKQCNILLSKYIAIKNAQPWFEPPKKPDVSGAITKVPRLPAISKLYENMQSWANASLNNI